MARPLSMGLKYTTLDLNFFQDRKVRRLQRKCDASAPIVYIALLCMIFREGYYVKWDEDFAFDLADTVHMDEDYVNGVLLACFDIGLLSEEMFKQHRVLTSAGIQKQYEVICEQSKRRKRVKEYSLLDVVSPEETHVSPEETPENASGRELSPEKCNKENKSKIKEIKENYSSSFPSSPDVEELTPEQEEKERIITFFTFSRNYINPNAEYGRLVSYNNSPAVRKKWNDMSSVERESIMEMWHPKKETVEDHKQRFDAATLSMWKDVFTAIADAPYDVRMAALSDGVRLDINKGVLTLTCPEILYQWIEMPGHPDSDSNLGLIKPIIFPFMKANGCTKLKYKNI